ncbi:MAG: AI-2E family transporter, partial [Chloroflexi bacterium]|nr:AI-2E family transporter [Chloroflexota bacterium]
LASLISISSVLVQAYYRLSATEAIDRKLLPRFSTSDQTQVRRIARRASESVGGWMRGELVLMLFVGSLAFVGLVLLGVDYPVPLAFWAGLTEIIPLIGPWIGGVPAFAIALLSSPWLALGVFLVYLAVQQIENNLLVPKIMEQAVGLHPLIVLLALLAGGATMGLLGIVISVPFAALVQVLIVELLIPWLAEQSRRREMAEYIESQAIAQESFGEVPVGSQGRGDDPEQGEPLRR